MVVQITISAIIFVVGCLCIFITGSIMQYLPFILGPILIILGIFRFHQVFEDLKYTRDEAFVAGNGTLYIVLGILILVKNSDSYYLIGVAWGMLGLIRDARNLTNHIFRLAQREDRFRDVIWHLIYCVFGISISIILLTDPPEHLHFHIMILGLEMFDSSFRILRDGLRYDNDQGLI